MDTGKPHAASDELLSQYMVLPVPDDFGPQSGNFEQLWDRESMYAFGRQFARQALRELLASDDFRAVWMVAGDRGTDEETDASNRLYDLARELGVDLWARE